MARAAVDALLYLLDDGFEGGRWHSLLGNLADVAPEEWRWVPPGGDRSIAAMVHHVAVRRVAETTYFAVSLKNGAPGSSSAVRVDHAGSNIS